MSTATTAVKERPIIMQAHNVRAILEGRKTQTRRVVKPQPQDCSAPGIGPLASWMGPRRFWEHESQTVVSPETLPDVLSRWCPYGSVGDRLWVKETWCPPDQSDRRTICYRASDDPVTTAERWRSSLMMPRWASRLTLEITGVRVERVQAITWFDAEAEGADPSLRPGFDADIDGGLSNTGTQAHIDAFRASWDAINGKRPGCAWKDNPFCWCISFKRLEQP